MEDISWVFRLFDRMSGPANRIAEALGKVGAQGEKAQKRIADVMRAQARAAVAIERANARVAISQNRLAEAQARIAANVQKAAMRQADLRVRRESAAAERIARIQARVTAAVKRAAAQQEAAAQRAATAQARIAASVEKAALRSAAAQARAAARADGGGGRRRREGLFGGVPLKIAGWYVTYRALMAMAKSITNAVTILPRTIVEQGIKHTALKEQITAGMSVVLGSEEKAKALVQEAIRFAAITPLTTEETLRGYQQIAMAGVAPERIKHLMAAVSDLSTINPEMRDLAIQGLTRNVMQVFAHGRLMGREVRDLATWGLPETKLYEALGSGIIPALKGASRDVIAQAVSNGQVSAEAFYFAMLEAVKRIGGGAVGEISERQSRTMAGLWSTLISRPQELFMNMDKSPMWEGLKKVLQNIVDATDINTPAGAALQDSLINAFTGILKPFVDWLKDPQEVQKSIAKWGTLLEQLVPAMVKLAEAAIVIANWITSWAGTKSTDKPAGWVPVGGATLAAQGVPQAPAGPARWVPQATSGPGAWVPQAAAGPGAWVPGVGASSWENPAALGPGGDISPSHMRLFVPRTQSGGPAIPTVKSGKVPLAANINVNVQGATREDAQAVADRVEDRVAMVIERYQTERAA